MWEWPHGGNVGWVQEIAGRWGSAQMRGENGIRMDKGLQNGDRDGSTGVKEVKGGWSGGVW